MVRRRGRGRDTKIENHSIYDNNNNNNKNNDNDNNNNNNNNFLLNRFF